MFTKHVTLGISTLFATRNLTRYSAFVGALTAVQLLAFPDSISAGMLSLPAMAPPPMITVPSVSNSGSSNRLVTPPTQGATTKGGYQAPPKPGTTTGGYPAPSRPDTDRGYPPPPKPGAATGSGYPPPPKSGTLKDGGYTPPTKQDAITDRGYPASPGPSSSSAGKNGPKPPVSQPVAAAPPPPPPGGDKGGRGNKSTSSSTTVSFPPKKPNNSQAADSSRDVASLDRIKDSRLPKGTAHEMKEGYGKGAELFVDRATGNIYVGRQDQTGKAEPTGRNINEF